MEPREWIEQFAKAAGGPVPSEAEVDQILELASVAAHSSERIAAPIACWIAAGAGLDPGRAKELAERIDGPG